MRIIIIMFMFMCLFFSRASNRASAGLHAWAFDDRCALIDTVRCRLIRKPAHAAALCPSAERPGASENALHRLISQPLRAAAFCAFLSVVLTVETAAVMRILPQVQELARNGERL